MSPPRPFDPFAGPSLGLVLDGAVHTVKRKTPDIKSCAAKLARVAKKAPEVLVKVSGSGKSPGQIRAHMDYITRNGKLEAENERGEAIHGAAEVKATFEKWGFDIEQVTTPTTCPRPSTSSCRCPRAPTRPQCLQPPAALPKPSSRATTSTSWRCTPTPSSRTCIYRSKRKAST